MKREKYTIRCNNCMKLFIDDEQLEQLKDNEGFFKGCPVCKTDSYLMDIDPITINTVPTQIKKRWQKVTFSKKDHFWVFYPPLYRINNKYDIPLLYKCIYMSFYTFSPVFLL